MTAMDGWMAIGVSVIGHDHVRREEPLQDANAGLAAPRPAAAVCDGAGSSAQSHVGATAAVRAFRVALAAMEPLFADALDEELPREFADELWHYAAGWLVRTLAAAREDAAREETGRPEDYAFTFAGAVVGRSRTGFVQVGDGAMCAVGRQGQGVLVFRPEKGRYANTTNFLGFESVEKDAYMSHTLRTADLGGIVAMSDGAAVKMIYEREGRPAPIVEKMVGDFAAGELDRASLVWYLTGKRWFDDPRGGDDKSVVILARKGRTEKEEKRT